MRAGAYGLSLLSDPLDVQVLRALEPGALPLIDLRRAVGSPPPTTLRGHLRNLAELGIVASERRREFPSSVSHQLTDSGRELLYALGVLAAWLARSPEQPLQAASAAAKSAIKALVNGWSANMLRALAARPLSLTALDRLITAVNYPSLERRLGAMRLAGQIVPVPGSGTTPYQVTPWLREGMGPLLAAAHWERCHAPGTSDPLRQHDVEAAFLLAIPLLVLPPTVKGSCRLGVEISTDAGSTLVGVEVGVERGRPVSCAAKRRAEGASSWAVGSATDWLKTLSGCDGANLELGGDRDLAATLVAGLRRALLPANERPHDDRGEPLAGAVPHTRKPADLAFAGRIDGKSRATRARRRPPLTTP